MFSLSLSTSLSLRAIVFVAHGEFKRERRNTCQPNKHLLKDLWYTSNIYMTGWTVGPSFLFFFSLLASISPLSLSLSTNCVLLQTYRTPLYQLSNTENSSPKCRAQQSISGCNYTSQCLCPWLDSPHLIAFYFFVYVCVCVLSNFVFSLAAACCSWHWCGISKPILFSVKSISTLLFFACTLFPFLSSTSWPFATQSSRRP